MYDSENALSRRHSTYSIGIPVASKLKPTPQQHKLQTTVKQKSANLCKFKTGIYLSFLPNRLCFCHITFILEWYDLTNCKKRRRIKTYSP